MPTAKSDKYVSNNILFVGFALVSSLINYLYYPVIAHFLPTSQFGAVQSLIAILLQISALFAGLNLITIYVVRRFEPDRARTIIESLQRITVLIFILATALALIFSNNLLAFLHIPNRFYMLLVGLDLITSVPFILAFGYLQAHRRFAAAGSLQLSVVLTKLLLGAWAAKIYGPSGALAGIMIGQVVGMGVWWLIAKLSDVPTWGHSILGVLSLPARQELIRLQSFGWEMASLFMVNVLLTIFISFDIIAARHYFPPALSGLYAGASTLSNSIVFVCLPLIGVLLPYLELALFRKSRHQIIKTASMVAILSLIGILFFKAIPGPLLSIFGHQYIVMDYILWRLGTLMALVALISLALQVSAFYRPRLAAITCLAGFALLIVFVVHNHSSPLIFVSTIMKVFATILLLGCLELIWINRRGRNSLK